MPTYNDYGIVLNSYNLGESDKILNIYTKENGLVRAVCKGLRKINSRFGGKLDQLSCCYFHLAKGKNLDTICDCEQVNSFASLRTDLIKLTYGILFLEIVKGFAHENEIVSNDVYDLLYLSLDDLQQTLNPELFALKFISHFLSLHGYKPQTKTCVSCGLEVLKSRSLEVLEHGRIYPFSIALGGILCRDCANLIEHKSVNCSVLEILVKLESRNHKLETEKDRESICTALRLLKEHIDARAKNKIQTFDLVFSL